MNKYPFSPITPAERARAEEALRESEEHLSALIHQTLSGIAETDTDGTFLLVNDRYCAITGYAREELVGLKQMQELTHPDDLPRNLELLARCATEGVPFEIEKRYLRKDGSLVWVNNSVSAIRRSDGSIQSLLAVTLDITAHKQAEQRREFLLKLSDALRLILDPAEIHSVVTHQTRDFMKADRCYYCEIVAETAIIRRDAAREELPLVVGEYPLNNFPIFKAVIDAGQPFQVVDANTTDLLDEELRQLCLELKMVSFLDVPVIKEGKPVGIFCLTQTTPRHWTEFEMELAAETAERTWAAVERAKTEHALRNSEERFRAIVNQASAGICRADMSGKLIQVNQKMCEMLGYSMNELTGKTIWEITFPNDLPANEDLFAQLRNAGRPFVMEKRLLQKGGKPLWVNVSVAAINGTDGKPETTVAVVIDIDERKRAEEALRDREGRLRLAIEATGGGTFTSYFDGRPNEADEGSQALFGFKPGEWRGDKESAYARIVHEDRAAVQQAVVQAIEQHRPYHSEFRVKLPDGAVRWLTGLGKAEYDAHGKPVLMRGVNLDITARKAAEEALRESEEKYRTLFETIDEGFCVIELIADENAQVVDYRFLNVNRVFERQTGLANAVGKLSSEIAPDTENSWFETYRQVAQTGEPVRFVNYHQTTGRWYEVYASRIGGAGSRQVCTVFNDITERKRREQEQEYLLKLSDALRTEADPIVIEETVTRLAMDFFAADRCYYAAIEGDQAIISRDAQRGDLPSVAATYRMSDFPIFQKVVDEGCPFVVYDANTTDVLDEELREMCLRMSVVSFVDVPVIKNGKVAGVFSLVQSAPRQWTQTEVDLMVVTAERIWAAVERATAERNLIVSEGRFRTITEAAPALVWVCSAPDGANIFFSQKWYEFTGQTREEAAGYGWTNATHPEDWERIAPYWRRCQQTGEPYQGEVRYRRRDGEWRWFNFRALPLRTSSGSIESWYGISIEIHDEKIAKEALRESQMRMTSLFQHAQNAILLANNEACYVDANPAACHLTGLTREELLQKNVWDLTPEPALERGLQLWREFIQAGQQTGEYALRRKDGTLRIVEFRAVANILPGLHLSVLQDVTERKETEAALQRAYDELAKANAELLGQEKERRELVRRLISAQEVERQRLSLELHDQTAQHLAALRMLLGALSEPLESHPEHFEILTQVQQLTEQLSRELHTLAWELRPMRLQEAGLAAAAEQYVKEWSVRCGIVADFHFRGDRQRRFPGLHEITVYRFIQEALTNALKYSQARQVTVALEYFPDRLRAIVEDDGVGFDPEQSTEINGGLGLRGIRERLALVNGELEIESSLGHGTALFLNLPLPDNQQPKGAS
ncbi:MAG: PAS domain S-box protein [Acidobacteria bacterium]|nr:PAS domain S-box protein [Acidobacteriota bacterium]